MQAPVLTREMAAEVHNMISKVNIPAGQAHIAVTLLAAVAAIANGDVMVVAKDQETPDNVRQLSGRSAENQ